MSVNQCYICQRLHLPNFDIDVYLIACDIRSKFICSDCAEHHPDFVLCDHCHTHHNEKEIEFCETSSRYMNN